MLKGWRKNGTPMAVAEGYSGLSSAVRSITFLRASRLATSWVALRSTSDVMLLSSSTGES